MWQQQQCERTVLECLSVDTLPCKCKTSGLCTSWHCLCAWGTLPALPPPLPALVMITAPCAPHFEFKTPRCMPLPSIATLGRVLRSRSVATALIEAGEVQKQGPQGSGSSKKMRHRDGHRMETVYRCGQQGLEGAG